MKFKVLYVIASLCVAFTGLGSCKEWVNPSKAPGEKEMEALRNGTKAPSVSTATPTPKPILPQTVTSGKTEITVNMAPRPDHPSETDAIIKEIEMFEKANTDIKVHISMWRYTPEDFLDRAKSRTLTDVVEVSASQMPAIIERGYAADISNEIVGYPDYAQIRPEAAQLCMKDGRVYGVPGELNTMALFYNRKLFAEVEHAERKAAEPAPAPSPTPKPERKKNTAGRSKGGGADFENESVGNYVTAQLLPWDRRPREGSAVNERRQAPAPTPRRGLISRIFGGQPQPAELQQEPETADPNAEIPVEGENAQPASAQQPQDASAYVPTVSDLESAAPLFDDTGAPVDLFPDKPNKESTVASIDRRERITSVTETFPIPKTWDEMLKAAVKMTDHSLPRYGYAPVCISYEGGRELAQWGIQSGVERLEFLQDGKLKTDLASTMSVRALSWMSDLYYKYDVTPPLSRCAAGNVLKMFASGQIAMIMLPADLETFEKLQRNGMSIDDIGVAKVPAGPSNNKQLVEGKCYIVNTQANSQKRKAALKWIMFRHNTQRIALRARILANERELIGTPSVPIYMKERQTEIENAIAQYRAVPQYPEYEKDLLTKIATQPAWFKKNLYAAVGRELNRMLDKKADVNVEPMQLAENFMENSLVNNSGKTEERLKNQLRDFVETAQRELKAVRQKTAAPAE